MKPGTPRAAPGSDRRSGGCICVSHLALPIDELDEAGCLLLSSHRSTSRAVLNSKPRYRSNHAGVATAPDGSPGVEGLALVPHVRLPQPVDRALLRRIRLSAAGRRDGLGACMRRIVRRSRSQSVSNSRSPVRDSSLPSAKRTSRLTGPWRLERHILSTSHSCPL